MQIFCVEWCKECGVIRFSVVFIFCNDLYNNATKSSARKGFCAEDLRICRVK